MSRIIFGIIRCGCSNKEAYLKFQDLSVHLAGDEEQSGSEQTLQKVSDVLGVRDMVT